MLFNVGNCNSLVNVADCTATVSHSRNKIYNMAAHIQYPDVAST